MNEIFAQEQEKEVAAPKTASFHAGELRDKYAGVFEAQIVRPALAELAERRAELQAELDGETETTARRGLQAQVAKIDAATAALSRASVEAQTGMFAGIFQALGK